MREILRLMQALQYALEGLVYLVKEQKNTRLLMVIMALTLIICPLLGFSGFQTAVVFLAVTITAVAEIINTAVEITLDLICNGKFHPRVKIAKDTASCAVLFCVFASVVVFLIILAQNIFA
ncbi:diacylglycerol kinase family protein [Thermincola potens]|uniref:Diacylglycerol kinase n=1 Tax=Thermincola potens (strain JR) TaxID=635013 RepID=D5X9B6_THEPJ|nr:diacylglycerol kinase family protein [Thermincola potens]ADG83020.1 diacylglycerol kinase [Thermincola potens JR]